MENKADEVHRENILLKPKSQLYLFAQRTNENTISKCENHGLVFPEVSEAHNM